MSTAEINGNEKLEEYFFFSKKIRKTILEMVYKTRSPHIGSSFSCVEILISLYFRFLSIRPDDPSNPNRDRFILSKGHACAALYAVLAERGFLDENALKGFAIDGGLLEQHPRKNVLTGIEASTGSLGHGLSIGVGMALAAKRDGKNYKVYVLLSDGELNEGSTWEAIMFASHHDLGNLVAIVDCNKMQALGRTKDVINLDPIAQKWISFGWGAREIDGHDYYQIFRAFNELPFFAGKPCVIVANTVKGKGISFMEDKLLWHYRTPDDSEYEMGLRELSE